MSAAPFLALLVIAMLTLAALRLELDFRRACKAGPGAEPRDPKPESSAPRPVPSAPWPELRATPAGGYCQAPLSAAACR